MFLEQQPAILGGGDVQRRAALESQLVPQVLRDGQGAFFAHAFLCVHQHTSFVVASLCIVRACDRLPGGRLH